MGAIDTANIVVIVFGAVAVVVTVAAFALVANTWRSRAGFDSTIADDEERSGPTNAPYPPGSRPAGPGAESMYVPERGRAAPGPPPDRPRR